MKSKCGCSVGSLSRLITIALTMVVGCGKRVDQVEKCDIQGRVTFQGKPVPRGTIAFEPIASKGNVGTSGFAIIQDGYYDTRRKGKGVHAGPVTVWVAGFDGVIQADAESGHGAPLFPTYSTPRDVSPQTAIDVDVPSQ
jgi:hypothetical protein